MTAAKSATALAGRCSRRPCSPRLLAVSTPSIARAQQVVAFVNGEPITTLDVEHRAKFMQMSTQKAADAARR